TVTGDATRIMEEREAERAYREAVDAEQEAGASTFARSQPNSAARSAADHSSAVVATRPPASPAPPPATEALTKDGLGYDPNVPLGYSADRLAGEYFNPREIPATKQQASGSGDAKGDKNSGGKDKDGGSPPPGSDKPQPPGAPPQAGDNQKGNFIDS